MMTTVYAIYCPRTETVIFRRGEPPSLIHPAFRKINEPFVVCEHAYGVWYDVCEHSYGVWYDVSSPSNARKEVI